MMVGAMSKETRSGQFAIAERAEPLLPGLKQRAKAVDENGLAANDLADLRAAGLLRLLQPRRYGGDELSWREAQEAGRLISRVCASSAWVTSVMGAHAVLVGRMSQAAQEDVWGATPDALIAVATRCEGVSLDDGGTPRLSGRWLHVEGAEIADWLLLCVPGEEGNAPSNDGLAGGAYRFALVPRGDCALDAAKFAGGLRGIAPRHVTVRNLAVAASHVAAAGELFSPRSPGASLHSGELYRVQFAPYWRSALVGPLLGCAEGAYANYAEITRKRVGGTSKAKVAEFTHVQQRLAESSAELKCAQLLYEEIMKGLPRHSGNGRAPSSDTAIELARDRSYLAVLCRNAVTRLVRQMGAMGLAEINPVQRQYRDVNALASYPALDAARDFAAFGRLELGLLASGETA